MDGHFSSHPIVAFVASQEGIVAAPVALLQEVKQEAKILSAVSLPAIAPIVEVDTMVAKTIHQSLGNSEIFQDLNVLEYLYTKNKNPELLQPLVEKFIQYYQFDKANQYLSLLVQEKGDYLKLAIDPRKVIYTRFHDSSIGLDSATALNEIFALAQQYRSHDLLTQDDDLFYKGLKSLWIYDYSGATTSFSKITDPRYKDFKASYDSALSNFVKIKNPPSYYRDGLVSLTLLKN
ncbi:TPA: hypothetical protein DCZ39_01175 [Patescibacteria group bacterium]|nr:hypothetical protein [Candidatus Gracilibacteria bacterium]